jgi:hypothetical protein
VNAESWLGALRYAASSGQNSLVLDCAESMHWFSDRWMHGPHWHEVFTLGAEAAAALGDLAQQATQLNYLAWVHSMPPEDPEATLRCAVEALDLATRSGATTQIAWAHEYTGRALILLRRFDEAVVSTSRAAEMFKADGDIDAYCQCLQGIACCFLDDGRVEEALEKFREGYDLAGDEGSGMTPKIATFFRPHALVRIGECLRLLGRGDEAIAAFAEGITLMERLQLFSHGPYAGALESLAAVLAERDRVEESRTAYARAAEAFETIGDTEASHRCRDLATAAR